MSLSSILSPLLRLPRELRDEIYFLLFESTRLAFGVRKEHYQATEKSKKTKPAPNSLAILRVCRQINGETHDIWVSRVTFNYESPKAFMSNMSSVPPPIVGQMRRMMIFYHSGEWSIPYGVENRTIYEFPTLLRLFPSLNLTTLTIPHDCLFGMTPDYLFGLFISPARVGKHRESLQRLLAGFGGRMTTRTRPSARKNGRRG
jgi:hypothetical protein